MIRHWWIDRESHAIYARLAEGAPDDIRTDRDSLFYMWSWPCAVALAELGWAAMWRAKDCEGCNRRKAKLKAHFAAWRELISLFRRCKDCD